MAQIRPITVAEMVRGETYLPGTMIFCIETLPVVGPNGKKAYGFQTQIWLPPEFREPTVENAKYAMAYLREIDADARRMIDKVAAVARDPRSRAEAKRRGLEERHYPPNEAVQFFS